MDEGSIEASIDEVAPSADDSTPDDRLPWYWVFDGRELHPFTAPTFVLPATETFELEMANDPAAPATEVPDFGDTSSAPVGPAIRTVETDDLAADNARLCRNPAGRRPVEEGMSELSPFTIDGRCTALCLLSGFVAVCAVVGAAGLIIGMIEPEAHLPFHGSPVIALLLVLLGAAPMFWTAVDAARGSPLAPMLALTSGLLLLGGIVVHWVLTRSAGGPMLVYAVAGCVVAALGIALGRPRRAERPR
ncbi:hypothetical protein [Nocardia paucivorans]|uniref:hypothetical protein n=1 Tax=Nocardia paucivorans TaxID=114259 RepID=UPI00030B59AF|nr:hypothetical protein [Nocardia paucivorans]